MTALHPLRQHVQLGSEVRWPAMTMCKRIKLVYAADLCLTPQAVLTCMLINSGVHVPSCTKGDNTLTCSIPE